jgi:ApaG protein
LMYEAITRGVRVRVEPEYDSVRSQPAAGRYFWIYTVEITNVGREHVQLVTRHWDIVDATGARETVEGPGVVGKSPSLAPGESFTYTSGCPLTTASGIMRGHYRMVGDDGALFEVEIPAFSLDAPFEDRTVN